MTDLTPEPLAEWREDAEHRQPLGVAEQSRRILALLDALAASETAREEAERGQRIASDEVHRLNSLRYSERKEHAALRGGITALTGDCYTFGSGVRCLDVIGGSFPGGATFTEEHACLPCRLRSLLARVDAPNPDAHE